MSSKNLERLINTEYPDYNTLGLCDYFGIPYIDKPVFMNQMIGSTKGKPLKSIEKNFLRIKIYEAIPAGVESDDLLQEVPWNFNDPKHNHLSVNLPAVYR